MGLEVEACSCVTHIECGRSWVCSKSSQEHENDTVQQHCGHSHSDMDGISVLTQWATFTTG